MWAVYHIYTIIYTLNIIFKKKISNALPSPGLIHVYSGDHKIFQMQWLRLQAALLYEARAGRCFGDCSGQRSSSSWNVSSDVPGFEFAGPPVVHIELSYHACCILIIYWYRQTIYIYIHRSWCMLMQKTSGICLGVPCHALPAFWGIRGWIHISIDSPRLVKQSQCSAQRDPPRYAAQGGYFNCCMHLLIARADANCEDEDTRPSRPLRAAMGKAVPGWIFWYNLMWKLIQGESTVHPDIIWHATTWKRSHGQWPRDSLMKACLCECVADEPSVEQQLPEDDRRCVEPTLCGFALREDGMRPLHFAASSGNLSVCELLIQSLSVQISTQNS